MDFVNSLSSTLARVIRNGSRRNQAHILDDVLAEAARWKPIGFDDAQRRRRDHYEGRSRQWVQAQLKVLFPKSWQKIPVLPYNWARLHAEVSAALYDEEPVRSILRNGVQLPADDEQAKTFAAVLRTAGVRTVLPEAERIMRWTRQVVIAVRVRGFYDARTRSVRKRVALDILWPNDVGVVPHPSAPTDPHMAIAIVVRSSGPGGYQPPREAEWYELWSRDAETDDFGYVTRFSPWRVSRISRGGDADPHTLSGTPLEYAGSRMPFLFLRSGPACGCPWVDVGDDDLHLVEMLNVDASDAAFIEHLQGHTDRVYKGTRGIKDQLDGGPDKTIQIDTAESIEALDYNPKLDEMGKGLERRLKLWAATKRHSRDAYATDPQVPQSGVARRIENEPQEKMRREAEAVGKDFEELELLPTIADVHDTFVTDEPAIGGADIEYRFTPATRATYEDPSQRQTRLIEAKDDGGISPARCYVEAGYYQTIEEAVEKGLSDELKTPSMSMNRQAGSGSSRFLDRLQRMRDAPQQDESPADALETNDGQ